jgi:mRNA interferase RelE/StbE
VTYRLVLEPRAERQLAALDKTIRTRIVRALHRTVQNPHRASNVKALAGGGFRLRVGDYRVLFDVMDDILVVLIVAVGHRREVYRRP